MKALDRCREAWEAAGLIWQDGADGNASAQAPDHSTADRSVTFKQIEGMVLVNSLADPKDQVLDAVGLTVADLYDDPKGATYFYPDGRTVHRSPSKKFRQSGNTSGHTLFRADRLEASPEAQVYVVEGEKDVLALESLGAVAVCNAGGAGKAHLFDWTPLTGRSVTVVADDDDPGRKHAHDIAGLLELVAQDVDIVTAKSGKDAADHVAAGHGLGDFQPVEVPGPKLWRADALRGARRMEWLAARRLPRSAVSLLVGDEGIGKSLLWVLLVSAITTGRALSEFGIPARRPENILIVVTEDDWSSTVRPRLELAGANLSMITVICEDEDGSGHPVFPRDMHLVHRAIRTGRPSLVVVDAWVDTVDARLKIANPQDARQALGPWREAAISGDCAVLLLTHTNRERSGNARDKYGLTGELRKKARMTLLAQLDDAGNLSVGPEKSNLVGNVPATLFRVEPVQVFAPTEDDDGTVPRLAHVGEDKRTSREILADAFSGDDGDDHDEIDKWLLALLANGAVKATEVYSAADANGYSKDQAKRAKKRLKIEAVKQSGSGPWMWTVPELAGTFEWPDDLSGIESTKGAENPPVPDGRSLAPLQVTGAPLVSDQTKGADQGPQEDGRSLGADVPSEAVEHVLESLSADFPQDARNIRNSVDPRHRNHVDAVLDALVADGLVTELRGKYLRVKGAA